MKRIRKIISTLIWSIAGLYIFLIVLAHVPPVQSFLGAKASDMLSDKFGCKVQVGDINLGFFNRLIIDDVLFYDQQGKKMLSATRLSVKFDYLSLPQGRFSITSMQLFGLNANLYKATAQSKPNYQFVLDSLASKDTTQHKPLDLSIKSLIIRNGSMSYNQLDIPPSSTMSLNHLKIEGISAHIILNTLKDDTLNLNVKRLAFKEKKGLQVKEMRLKFIANRNLATLRNFSLKLPKSSVSIPNLVASYKYERGKLELASLQYEGAISNSIITLSDLACFEKSFNNFVNPISLYCDFIGTSTSLRIKSLDISANKGRVRLLANGSIRNWDTTPRWNADVEKLQAGVEDVKFFTINRDKQINIPEEITRLGNISYHGEMGGFGKSLSVSGQLLTNAGDLKVKASKKNETFFGHVETNGFDLERVLNNDHFGLIAANLDLDGKTHNGNVPDIKAKGTVSRFDYNNYSYRNLTVNGSFIDKVFSGQFNMDDPNGNLSIDGTIDTKPRHHSANVSLKVRDFNPSALQITNKWAGKTFSFDAEAKGNGENFNSADGAISVSNFSMKSGKNTYNINSLTLNANRLEQDRVIDMESDFGSMKVVGDFDYAALMQSLIGQIASKLPTFPGLPKQTAHKKSNFTIDARFTDTKWLENIFSIPLEINSPMTIKGGLDDNDNEMELVLNMPDFTYDGTNYREGRVALNTVSDTLKADAKLRQMADGRLGTVWNVKAAAADNKLNTVLSFSNTGKRKFSGNIDSDTQFFKSEQNKSTAHIVVHPSIINVGDSVWQVEPSDILYNKNNLLVDHFALSHNKQHIYISGKASDSFKDTLTVDLKGVDLSYILNLVNFHAVDFSGFATGYAYVSNVFAQPEARLDMMVNDFRFENGRMGVLSANATLNKEQQIDIDAIAYDEKNARTIIKGYVSPKRHYIDLGIAAHNTRGEFLEGFLNSFMDRTDLRVDGNTRVFGDLSTINLEGDMVVNGTARIKPTNTTYELRNADILMKPDSILFRGDSIFDRNGNVGIVSGLLHHRHLTRLEYGIDIKANNLLAYDTNSFGEDTFYGTVYATGDCSIHGRPGDLDIAVNVKPEKGSFIEYNAASPESISNQSFIHWSDRGDTIFVDSLKFAHKERDNEENIDIPTDVHLNFIIDCTPDASLRVLMDKQSGDLITLNGSGTLRATYFNKGDFQMFGNYVVDHGSYNLTIQNVIKRDFSFMPGGTIVFGGEPFDANLNLQALYVVNGVSLSDLNIGNSFSSNNIRVNCLMNIKGTPASPQIDFSMDMPTVNSDAKQMIMNLINSEEEMNQQVLYLLAIGRFYSQGSNNAAIEGSQQSQTSLAMQSILSGQLSQQINNVLSTVINNSNWNFGANISTGDEGWNNAEYEGVLSGRMFNNRLLFNGQFGYRDNANATTSFIGDFDLRYLIFPNGNFAIRVYNMTNDRYFTRNSLTTQGLGIILKKDFNGWRDLFGIKKKSKKAKKEKKTEKKDEQ